MKLKCKINETIYENVVQGQAFAEEYNETLDSGTLVISHVSVIKLKPYDDVYVWDADYEFEGFYSDKIIMSGVEYTFDEETLKFKDTNGKSVFYKHLLVDTFSEEMINLRDFMADKGIESYSPIYEYKIQLMSETKGLEAVQLPNIAVTQSLNIAYKVSAWDYLLRYIKMYSPVYKVVVDKSKKVWKFQRKYSISENLKKTLDNVFPPDFSLNNPNLKDVFAKILLCKDLIPYVVNNVVYAMDITKRKGIFDINLNYVNYISGNLTSQNYCDALKKSYSNALSQDNTARMVEYIGFRNSDNALMTLENMRLETRFPIYRINKIYMCYYKQVIVADATSNKEEKKIFLCKQDITPLVKLNTERNVLSEDWTDINSEEIPQSVEELARYKLSTVGYDIGSNVITGWGTKYKYPKEGTFWEVSKTYIENIYTIMDQISVYGVYGSEYVKQKFISKTDPDYYNKYTYCEQNIEGKVNIISPFANPYKSFIFQVDYQAFYNGTVIHSKDNGLDNIVINDNPSSSLTLLEQDGLFTKEKVNRFGNKGLVINARYDNIDQLQPLGSVYEDENNKDVIIYHREYQIWDNYIMATYYGIQDYVLKNYYTSVYARHRTWDLMPYEESVNRAENRKMMVYLSTKNIYWEDFRDPYMNNKVFEFSQFEKPITSILSCFTPTEQPTAIDYFEEKDKINYGFLINKDQYYVADLNAFLNGYSLCFNIAMSDNISAGTYIEVINPKEDGLFNSQYDISNIKLSLDTLETYLLARDVEDDYTGSKQSWYNMVDSSQTGAIEYLGVYLCHFDQTNLYDRIFIDEDTKKDDENKGRIEVKNIYAESVLLPKTKRENFSSSTNRIGGDFNINKDNKEVIDMTFQIEPVTNDKNIMFSQWFLKLSNLLNNYQKFENGFEVHDINLRTEENLPITVIGGVFNVSGLMPDSDECYPGFYLKLSKDAYSIMEQKFKNGNSMELGVKFNFKKRTITLSPFDKEVKKYQITFKKIENVENGKITLSTNEYYDYAKPTKDKTKKRNVIFSKVDFLSTDTEYYFGWHGERDRYITGSGLETFCAELKNKPMIYTFGLDTAEKYKKEMDRCCEFYNTTLYSEVQEEKVKKYDQNMYVLVSNKKLDKSIIYDEYKFVTHFSPNVEYKLNDVVSYSEDEQNYELYRYINVVPSYGEWSEYKWEKVENAVLDYTGTLYVENASSDFWVKNGLTIIDKDVKETFVINESYSAPYIRINLKDISDDVQSIHYWYLDKGSLKFVFGVNVEERNEDGSLPDHLDVYISLLSTRDTKIFDGHHRIVGNTHNFLNDDTSYGVDQLYLENEGYNENNIIELREALTQSRQKTWIKLNSEDKMELKSSWGNPEVLTTEAIPIDKGLKIEKYRLSAKIDFEKSYTVSNLLLARDFNEVYLNSDLQSGTTKYFDICSISKAVNLYLVNSSYTNSSFEQISTVNFRIEDKSEEKYIPLKLITPISLSDLLVEAYAELDLFKCSLYTNFPKFFKLKIDRKTSYQPFAALGELKDYETLYYGDFLTIKFDYEKGKAIGKYYKEDKKLEIGHRNYTIDEELYIRDEQGESIGFIWSADETFYINNEEFFIDGDVIRSDLGTKEAFDLKKITINDEEREYNEDQGISITVDKNINVNAEFELAKVEVKTYLEEEVKDIVIQKVSSQYGDVNSLDYYVGDIITINVISASDQYETSPKINGAAWENERPYQIKRKGLLPIEVKVQKKS